MLPVAPDAAEALFRVVDAAAERAHRPAIYPERGRRRVRARWVAPAESGWPRPPGPGVVQRAAEGVWKAAIGFRRS
jgi:hypothetical protein